MTPPRVHEYLEQIGRKWTGLGVAVELGAWLGASSAALLTGLVEAGYNLPYYVYDRWIANEAQVKKAHTVGVTITDGQDLLPLFLKNVSGYKHINTVQGNISNTIHTYPGGPIEVCLFDAPKRNPVFTVAIQAVLPHFIPGVTVLGLLDYYFHRFRHPQDGRFLAPVKFIEQNSRYFKKIKEWTEPDAMHSPVFFRYVKPLKL